VRAWGEGSHAGGADAADAARQLFWVASINRAGKSCYGTFNGILPAGLPRIAIQEHFTTPAWQSFAICDDFPRI
jgi:hypothetical protein